MRASLLCLWVLACGVCACTRASMTGPPPSTGIYQCGDLAIVAEILGNEAATLTIKGLTFKLHRVPSRYGAKYVDDAGNKFLNQGGVMLILDGQPLRECTLAGVD